MRRSADAAVPDGEAPLVAEAQHQFFADSQEDSQADARQRTEAADGGLATSATELHRTLVDGRGHEPRGLQNRLGGVRRRPSKFTFVRQRPCWNRMKAKDSQDVELEVHSCLTA